MDDEPPTRRVDPDDRPTVRGLAAGLRVFGRYTLEVQAGRGGMGVVWRARDEKLNRTVALKFLPPEVAADAEAVNDLKLETTRCLELTHPYIVRVYDFVESEAHSAIAMEFVDGESLAKRKVAASGRCLGVAELAPWVAQLCAALDYAHADAKIVHRDLKPANLLVTRDGKLKVTDFGIARSLSETHTRLTGRTAGTSGTLLYMSPQQLRGLNAKASDDIYALGVTLYELLTGKPPFFTGDISHQVFHETPAPLEIRRAELGGTGAPIPRAWEETILACLAKEPKDRPHTAGEVGRRLKLTTDGTDQGASEPKVARVIPNAPSIEPGDAATQRIKPFDSASAPSRSSADNPLHPPKSKIPLFAVVAAVVLLALGGWYWFGVAAPAREKMRSAEATAQAEASRLRLQREAADAETKKLQLQKEEAETTRLAEIRKLELQKEQAEAARVANARGGLIVTTTPPGAEITVGGFALERSPASLKEVKLGKYPVVIRLAGYEDERREAEVKENEFASLEVALVRSTGTVQVASVPVGLAYALAGPERTQRGKTPATLEKLPTGNYTLTVSREGWPEQKQTVMVLRNQSVSAFAEFLAGALEIASIPSGAEVFLAGKRMGVTPLRYDEMIPGRFAFELRLKGFKAAYARGEVRAKETARAAVTLEKEPRPEVGQRWTIPELDLEMVPIAAGTFTMGSPDNEEGRTREEGPQTRVTHTRPFWLGKTEVTQREWTVVMGNNPSNFKGEDRPVEDVSWEDAMEFCRRLTARERAADRLPAGLAYTLPTEAQWEYACRAGTTGAYAGDVSAMAWYSGNSGSTTHEVAQKTANAWGLSDMHGNVWEWCADWYADKMPGGSVRDPVGPTSGSLRVLRGGGWDFTARGCRSAFRFGRVPGLRFGFVGFRLALISSS